MQSLQFNAQKIGNLQVFKYHFICRRGLHKLLKKLEYLYSPHEAEQSEFYKSLKTQVQAESQLNKIASFSQLQKAVGALDVFPFKEREDHSLKIHINRNFKLLIIQTMQRHSIQVSRSRSCSNAVILIFV